jgi:seryl-tRNA synthetase
MFAVTTDDEKVSQKMHDELVRIQTLLFDGLGLHFRFEQFFVYELFVFVFRILDMPSEELGLSAHRKYDIETWMPAKGFYGEVRFFRLNLSFF